MYIYYIYIYIYIRLIVYSELTLSTVGAGLAEGDENCKKFLERTMYDSFQKVHSSQYSLYIVYVLCLQI